MSRLFLHSRRRRTIGFTLIEVMISVAIVLVLMLGINYVFSTSAKTISVGMATTGVNREIRGARKVMESDFANAIPAEEMPALMIHNEVIYAWKDKQDKLADADGDPSTFDVDGAPGDEYNLGGTNPATWAAANLPGLFNYRRHRIDRIAFFVRNGTEPYRRQTGDDNTYVSNVTSSDAWVQYGLLRLADNSDLAYWKPGARGDKAGGVFPDEQANQNNFFAMQWILGRKLMLLADPAALPQRTTFIAAATNTPAGSLLGINFAAQAQRTTATTPQAFNRESPPYATPTPWRPEESRVDMVGVYPIGAATAGSPMQRMRARFVALGASAYWNDSDPTTTTPNTNRDRRFFNDPAAGLSINYLSWAKPFVNKSNFAASLPNQTRETALTTPIFLRGVTQFIVEFAGDFYDQGTAANPEPLGTIDYVEVPNPSGSGVATQIRWYGLPRETDGIAGIGPADTRPLMGNLGGVRNEPFIAGTTTPAPARWVGGSTTPTNLTPEKPRQVATAPYVFAWSPTAGTLPVAAVGAGPSTPGDPTFIRPSLIRITMELMDPNGRLADGQRIELVFRLKTPSFSS